MGLLAGSTAAYAWVAGPLLGAFYGAGGTKLPALSAVQPADPAGVTALLAAVVATVTGVRALARYGHDMLLARLEEDVIAQLRRELHAHVLRLPVPGPPHEGHGELGARIAQEVTGVRALLRLGLAGLARNGATAAALAAMALAIDPLIAGLALLGLPAAAVAVHQLARRSRRAQRDALQAGSRLAGGAAEAADLRALVRAYDAHDEATASYAHHVQRQHDATLRTRRLRALLPPLLDVLGGSAVIAALLLAVDRLETGALTGEGAVSLFAALLLLYRPVQSLGSVVQGLSSGLASIDRLGEVLGRAAEPADAPADGGAEPAPRFEEGLELERVSFRFGDRPVLDDVRLAVRPGESLAVVGISGAGKTTLLLLLLGLLEPDRGAIRMDGVDRRRVRPAAWRRRFAWVPQEPLVFADTALANIALGDPRPDRGRALEAARAAGAAGIVEALPQGLDTVLEDRGQNLSAGERQRLCLARALYRDAPILLLDEPTAALDGDAERRFSETIAALLGERTVVLASHRESTVRRMDRVIVLAEGRVVDEGTPAELAGRAGPYRALFPDLRPATGAEGPPLRAVGDEP